MQPILRILLIDDSIYLSAIESSLAPYPGIELVRMDTDQEDIPEVIEREQPSCLLITQSKQFDELSRQSIFIRGIPILLFDPDCNQLSVFDRHAYPANTQEEVARVFTMIQTGKSSTG